MLVAAAPQIKKGRCLKVVFKSVVTSLSFLLRSGKQIL